MLHGLRLGANTGDRAESLPGFRVLCGAALLLSSVGEAAAIFAVLYPSTYVG
jgi:hypothetical protein